MYGSSAPTTATTVTRVHGALTAGLEKRVLVWLAVRMPRWVTSDGLTALGLLAQVAAGVLYAAAGRWRPALAWVCVSLVLNWLGDSLDGTLARVRGQQRPRYGFYVDHMVDVVGSIALMTGLGLSGLVHWPVAIAMLVLFLALASESYLATCSLGRFHLSHGRFGPTEIRILLIAGNLALLRSPWATLFGHRVLLFDVGGAVAATLMLVMLLQVSLRHTVELYREEPLPPVPEGTTSFCAPQVRTSRSN